MFQYASNATLTEVADALRGASRVVVTTHAKPDGDALGAVLALAAALESMGKKAERWIMPPLPGTLKKLARGVKLHYHADDSNPLPQGEPDRIVVVDTGSWAQLRPLKSWLEARHERVIVVDHHLHGNDVGATMHVDPTAAAACQIVAALIETLGVERTPAICDALYTGIATDTGWFRFSNTSSETMDLAAQLMREGVDHAGLYRLLEQSERPQKLALLSRALASLQTVAGGRAAVMTLRSKDFSETGAQPEETERFVDLPQIVGDIEVVVIVVESKPSLTRLSFRSKPGAGAIDVNALAGHFGGGGHARASGAKVDKPVEAVMPELTAALEGALTQG